MKRTRGFFSLVGVALVDLFDQGTAFGRLALVHVLMMAGDTLVTISLAGSLFFSVSPDTAKIKVLAYLALTIAPFAVVSPLLGPLIDRAQHGRRFLVAISAGTRAILCFSMATHLNSLWLFPEAFVVLVSSKLYVVTRGALVPQMARSDQFAQHRAKLSRAGWPSSDPDGPAGFAGFNAQLTLLGTLAGFVIGFIGAGILKTAGASWVLYLATVIFCASVGMSARLVSPSPVKSERSELSQLERDHLRLNPKGNTEVAWGLFATTAMRAAVGFATFLLAFGLRREHANLGLYALALSASGVGSMLGLGLVTRMRTARSEPALLFASLLLGGAGALLASFEPLLGFQVLLAGWLGITASVLQPSFDSLTQRNIAEGSQGRTFARFAVRQQLAWVLGALVPVAVPLGFGFGDRILAIALMICAIWYAFGRRTSL
jgi:hypothetical protein